jgi:hypothetical protein
MRQNVTASTVSTPLPCDETTAEEWSSLQQRPTTAGLQFPAPARYHHFSSRPALHQGESDMRWKTLIVVSGLLGCPAAPSAFAESPNAGPPTTAGRQDVAKSDRTECLRLQNAVQNENTCADVPNIMKTKHDTSKNSISNVR